MEFKGTKGKWIYDFNGQYCDVYNEGRFDDAEKILSISSMLYDRQHNTISDIDENKANAKLIASAPELLEALQAMLSRFEHVDSDMVKSTYVKDMARKALEKALT